MSALKPHNFDIMNTKATAVKDLSDKAKATAFDDMMKFYGCEDISLEKAIQYFKTARDNRIVSRIEKSMNVAEINYTSEKEIFLNNTQSKATKDGYTHALAELEKYCLSQNLKSPLYLKSTHAEEYLYYLKSKALNKFGKPLAVATIRRDIAAASSFFTFLSKRHDTLKNIFIGLKSTPKKKLSSIPVYPSKEEVIKIYDYIGAGEDKSQLQRELASIVYVMARRGLRCGAFENLIITRQDSEDGNTRYIFETTSKGKSYRGVMPLSCVQKMKEAGIKTNAKSFRPYPEWTSDKIRNYFKYYTNQLYGKSKLVHGIEAPYSCHDLRHFYAMEEYKTDHDIYRLKGLLNHSDISTTAIYLRSLGADITE